MAKERSCSNLPSVIFSDNVYKIAEAIKTIQCGYCKRVDVSDKIKVYECKNTIRIDVRYEE